MEVKCLLTDEISMVLSDLWTDINTRIREAFFMIPKKIFAGLLVMTVAEFLQLPPFRRKLIFSQFSDKGSMNYLRGMQL